MNVRIIAAALLTIYFAPPASGQDVGVISPSGFTSCQVGTHRLVDPCTGQGFAIRSSAYNLEAHRCQEVVVWGFSEEPIPGCPVLNIQVLDPSPTSCPLEAKNLTLQGAQTTVVRWDNHFCFSQFDVIRGNLGNLSAAEDSVNLGPVTCIANDWSGGARPTDSLPPAEKGFVYLVRGSAPSVSGPWGFSSRFLPELPESGACP